MHEEDREGCLNRQLKQFTRRHFYSPRDPTLAGTLMATINLSHLDWPLIHGCVDGFSRRVMWLKVSSTNNDPRVIAQYFLDCVSALKVCPTVLRTDCGTENGSMAAIQSILRRAHNDSQACSSHRYGTSIANQRIECWWSHFRRGRIGFLIGQFKDLVDAGYLNLHNRTDIACCRYVFMDYIQRELDAIAAYWNTHSIRRSRQQPSVGGIPDELFFLPERSGVRDFGKTIGIDSVATCYEYVAASSAVTGDDNVDDYFTTVMARVGLQKSNEWHGCVNLYRNLRHIAQNGWTGTDGAGE